MKYLSILLICITQFFAGSVTAQCNAGFTYTINENTVSFTPSVLGNSSDSSRLIHSWYFGDGFTEFATHTSHTYTSQGQFTVRHVVVDSADNCVDTYSQTFTLNFTPTCSVSIYAGKNGQGFNQYYLGAITNVIGTKINSLKWFINDKLVYDTDSNELRRNGLGFSYAFPEVGVYQVCVKMGTEAGCISQDCKEIHVTSIEQCPLGQTSIIATTDSINKQLRYFKPQPDSSAFIYSWDFGDGATSTERYPSHIYQRSGNFQVSLVVDFWGAADSCRAFGNTNIYVDTLSADCSVRLITEQNTSLDNSYSFSTETNSKVKSWTWKINDSMVTSTTSRLDQPFADTGYYTVCVKMETVEGCIAEDYESVHVSSIEPCHAPPASFVTEADSSNPLKIAFVPVLESIGTYSQWAFGDSTYSHEINPVHTYKKAGVYTVIYEVRSNQPDSCGNTVQKDILVGQKSDSCHMPVPSFIASADSTNPLLIHFKQTPVNPDYSIKWQFGDGAISSDNSPSHLYSNAGSYTVVLQIKTGSNNDTCTASTTQQIIVKKDSSQLCRVAFTSWQDSVHPGLYHFAIKPDTTTAKYIWFINETPLGQYDSLNFNFVATGTYTTCIRMQAASGCVAEECQQIQVDKVDTCMPFSTSFLTVADSANPLKIKFIPVPDSAGYNYEWSFGDSMSSWDKSPTHIYNSAGLYYVHLLVKSDQPGNCSDGSSQPVNVALRDSSSCITSFSWAIDSTGIIMPNKLHFIANSSSQIVAQQWTIIDTNLAIEAVLNTINPVYTFTDTGYHQVCLSATATDGCIAKYCQMIHIASVTVQDTTQSQPSDDVLKVYPNPATNEFKFNLETTSNSQVRITIYNSQGMPVKQETRSAVAGNNLIKINIQTLQPGMYFSEIIYGNHRKTARFQKQ